MTPQLDPDRRDGAVYVYEPDLKLAVEVALVTGRPLLLMGEPGTGKSSWAAFAARNLGWRYYEHVVTSRTRASDVLWRFDSVRRLADAQVRGVGGAPLNDHDYVEPGVLWWVFDRESAARRGAVPPAPDTEPEDRQAPHALEPFAEANKGRSDHGCVVLLDEIDKADPDLPNGLLVPLASRQFLVTETGTEVKYRGRGRSSTNSADSDAAIEGLLLIITTNQERDLPPAFVRRCVVHRLRFPTQRLLEIATRHAAVEGEPLDAPDRQAAASIARRVVELRKEAIARGARPPGTAEYLDAIRAYRGLRLAGLDDSVWDVIERLTLLKDEEDEEDLPPDVAADDSTEGADIASAVAPQSE